MSTEILQILQSIIGLCIFTIVYFLTTPPLPMITLKQFFMLLLVLVILIIIYITLYYFYNITAFNL